MGGQTSRSIGERAQAAGEQIKESAKEATERVSGRECTHMPKHKQYTLPSKSPKLEETDFSFLTEHTGKSRDEIQQIFSKYNLEQENARLDKQNFKNIYSDLHPESNDYINDVTEQVFRAFDSECTGYISFNEFMVAYALTSRGDMRKKLEYAFNLYDVDKTGYLEKDEVRQVVTGMFDLLGVDKKHDNPPELIEKTVREIGTSPEGKVTRGINNNNNNNTIQTD